MTVPIRPPASSRGRRAALSAGLPARLSAGLLVGLTTTLVLTGLGRAQEGAQGGAQEGAPQSPPEAAAEAVPAPRRAKPKPKPRPKPAAKADPAEARPGEARPGEAKPGEAKPGEAKTAQERAGDTRPETEAHPATPAVTPRSATPFAAPVVACDPGQSVRYEGGTGAKGAELWVTRTGTVSVDNPLRPLTPDVTRVLQVVVGAKLATAYGPDLMTLRRGPSPGVLEGLLAGPVRWDAALGALPETLTLVSATGTAPAELRFRDCGDAPAVKAPDAGKKTPVADRKAPRAPKAAASSSAASSEARRPPAAPAVRTPPGFNLPQGAIQ